MMILRCDGRLANRPCGASFLGQMKTGRLITAGALTLITCERERC
ncbi:hypothetical protein PSJ8397_02709 [Pseudooctadecabacter jejudonensis]|uniref:Uncharacterized protein n=1 Tax=Pseudooctadecabacter jejudonensis TaxID=1391910 RepID=A0A1Y5SZH4_9RHOB|nr:hypothetical protein PSJ8397_02709 [Pseudooctadecabacter jejudonensis]